MIDFIGRLFLCCGVGFLIGSSDLSVAHIAVAAVLFAVGIAWTGAR